MQPCPVHVVTLVHGVQIVPRALKRRVHWTADGSRFRDVLARELGGHVEFRTFVWSGWITLRARRLAAADLSEQLQRQVQEFPQACHFIVAHSHGGNVTLYALCDREVQTGIKGIICLDTPFSYLLRQSKENAQIAAAILMSSAALGVLAIALFVCAFMRQNLIGPFGPFITMAIVATLLPYAYFVRRCWQQLHEAASTRENRGVMIGHMNPLEYREAMIDSINTPELYDTPVLCLHSSSDEVYIFFSLTEAVFNLPSTLQHYIIVLVFMGLAFAANSYYLPTLPMWGALQELGKSAPYLVLVFATSFIVMFYMCILWFFDILAVWGAQPLYGRVVRTLVPLTARRVEFHDVDAGGGVMRHWAAFAHEGTIIFIADWIRNGGQSKQDWSINFRRRPRPFLE